MAVARSRDVIMPAPPSAGLKTTDAALHNTMCVPTTTINMDILCGIVIWWLQTILVVGSLPRQWGWILGHGQGKRRMARTRVGSFTKPTTEPPTTVTILAILMR